MTRTACLALLGPTHENLWMDRQGERLRQAIDRKQVLIMRLLKIYGLEPQAQQASGQSASENSQTSEPAKPDASQEEAITTRVNDSSQEAGVEKP